MHGGNTIGEKDWSSIAMKKSGKRQMHGLKTRRKGIQRTERIEMKLRLILCWLVKTRKNV